MNLKNIEYKDHVTFIEFQTFFFNPWTWDWYIYVLSRYFTKHRIELASHSYVNSVQKAPKNIILCAIGTLNWSPHLSTCIYFFFLKKTHSF